MFKLILLTFDDQYISLLKKDVNINNRMPSLMIQARYELQGRDKKNYITTNAGYIFILQCCHLHIQWPHESPNKKIPTFYC